MSNPFKILVKLTTRERPERCFKTLDSIYSLAQRPDFLRVLITADSNDVSMNNDEVIKRINAYENTHIIFGESTNKINAINRDFDKLPKEWNDWQLVSNISDDMVYCIWGWDDIIRATANQFYPDFDCYLSFLDSDTKGALTTQLNIGRKYFERFNYLYHNDYISLFADNEGDDVAKHLEKYHFTGLEIYKHYNPSYGYTDYPPDQMYIEQQQIGWDIDHKTYLARKEKTFDLILNK